MSDLAIGGRRTADEGLREALLEFELAHSHVADTAGDVVTAPPLIDVAEREATLERTTAQIHDLLSERDQLLLHRFFLTAVHRGAVQNESFAPHNVGSPERQASRQAEFDDLTGEMSDMIDFVAARHNGGESVGGRLLASAFLWSMTWWRHARRDVIAFVDSSAVPVPAQLSLGRRADPRDAVSNRIYFEAAEADERYRRHLQSAARPPYLS